MSIRTCFQTSRFAIACLLAVSCRGGGAYEEERSVFAEMPVSDCIEDFFWWHRRLPKDYAEIRPLLACMAQVERGVADGIRGTRIPVRMAARTAIALACVTSSFGQRDVFQFVGIRPSYRLDRPVAIKVYSPSRAGQIFSVELLIKNGASFDICMPDVTDAGPEGRRTIEFPRFSSKGVGVLVWYPLRQRKNYTPKRGSLYRFEADDQGGMAPPAPNSGWITSGGRAAWSRTFTFR